jgi:hypothetical protein
MGALKARREWSEVYQALNENNFSPRILYTANYHLKSKEESVFHDKQTLK